VLADKRPVGSVVGAEAIEAAVRMRVVCDKDVPARRNGNMVSLEDRDSPAVEAVVTNGSPVITIEGVGGGRATSAACEVRPPSSQPS
jgi:hypothetical protein